MEVALEVLKFCYCCAELLNAGLVQVLELHVSSRIFSITNSPSPTPAELAAGPAPAGPVPAAVPATPAPAGPPRAPPPRPLGDPAEERPQDRAGHVGGEAGDEDLEGLLGG